MNLHRGGAYPSLESGKSKASFILNSKRVLLFGLILLFVVSGLSAASLTWKWENDDENIKFYRWQLNGVDDDKWTIENSEVTSKTLEIESESDTFFVEASYDGINWSEPATGSYIPEVKEEKKTVDWRTKKCEFSILLSPYSYQYVRYTGNHNPQTRASYYGLGGGVGFNYNIEENYSTGLDFVYQWHNYKDFHYYNSFKLSLSMRYRVFASEDLRYKVYLSHSIGADFVLRDDGDKGVYGLFGIIGITEDVRIIDGVSLTWGGNLSYTFQNGSNVLHFTPVIGVTYHWGENV